ncbi:1,2-phenylacetyl-CoA epoxidase subunit PaaC [Sporichthya polymorpha]|uniref:1,2-phenylacetyl-CoA epoxidase subunit PaaC n=1 Tax=Sporichthya polymorpha TaxID=35751 RepID=UPI00036C0787|nr:1,2-phenylacetyl-CoA epoxidase subunit PaaC [Sporichthya polymorpha]
MTSPNAVAAYALALGDDALILGQRLLEWITNAPELEEEVALANISLDLLGQARALLTYAGSFDGRDEDALAYRRAPEQFRCVHLVERPNGDFGATVARQLLFSAYQYELYAALTRSSDPTLAGVAGKAVKEVAYHRDHATMWTLRLGDGTGESHRRMQAGLEAMWSFAEELFAPDSATAGLVGLGAAVDASSLRPAWSKYVEAVLSEATLTVPQVESAPGGGRAGVRTPEFAALIEEMTSLHRAHPGATW